VPHRAHVPRRPAAAGPAHVILAEDEDEPHEALTALHDQQRRRLRGALTEMDGLPVTVRLLDPPLHEFLPDFDELLVAPRRPCIGWLPTVIRSRT
jgi:phosphoenolpyruvate synthase/pyruvate phosphate dikinase